MRMNTQEAVLSAYIVSVGKRPPRDARRSDGRLRYEKNKEASASNINVVLNWNQELLRLTGSANK